MKKSCHKQLKINRETLRSLALDDARRAAGGIPTMVGPVIRGAISMPARACCRGPEEVFLPPRGTMG